MFRNFENAIRFGIRDYAMLPCGPGPAKRVKRSLCLIFNNVGDEDDAGALSSKAAADVTSTRRIVRRDKLERKLVSR